MAPSATAMSSIKHGTSTGADINVLGTPFPPLKVEFSDDDLRETAYEILVAASGSSAMSARSMGPGGRSKAAEKSLTSAAASRVKKALGLHSKGPKDLQSSSSSKIKKPVTVAEIMRVQMQVSEQSDMRTRRALSRAAAGQASKRSELMLVPLELLQNIGSSAFTDQKEYQRWLKRQLRVLEAGLLAHPLVQGDGGLDSLRLKQTLQDMPNKSVETGKNSETMQALRNAAMGRATRALNGEYADCLHWADGFPLNVYLYKALLHACFDTLEEGSVVDEVDDMLDLIKKTWGVLGIDQMTHNLCFMWVLFHQFVVTGQTEADLLGASETQMIEVAKDAKLQVQPDQLQLLNATLSTMQSWAEKRLLAYHDSFPGGAKGPMEGLLSLAISAAEILHEDISQEYRRRRKDDSNVASSRIDVYVRSSIRTAFAQMMESVDMRRRSFKGTGGPPPALAILANDTSTLASEEVDNFSPVLKRWHPYAAGVAAATLHACYRREFKQYLSGTTSLTTDTVQILEAADQLEKHLVQIAVEDGVECEDGGKGLIREMPPFEADTAVADLSKKWVSDKLERMGDWVSRNVQQEQWQPNAIRERYARSVVEVLRIMEETLEAFFELPVSQYPDLLQDLVTGLDKALQRYASQTVAPCGTKDLHIPSLPPLTRCKTSSKSWLGLHKSKGRAEESNGSTTHRGPATGGDAFSLPYLCVRINTLQHIITELEFIEKKIRFGWQKDPTVTSNGGKSAKSAKSKPAAPPPVALSVDSSFKRTRGQVQEGVQQLIELAAYRVAFSDLRGTFWEGLYVGRVANARISSVTEQLDAKLGIIADTSSDRLRNPVVGALMRACFECFLLVLLAGGPSRAFTVSDADILKEDFGNLKDLFKADGEGLPSDVVEKAAARAAQVLSLFDLPSNELIEIFTSLDGVASRSGSRLSLPPTTGVWSASDANTVLRVLCYRCDDTASKFLKKSYHLPKKV